MSYAPLTKERLIEKMKGVPNHAVINIMYKDKGYTANIEVSLDLNNGATNQRNIIFLDAEKPNYLE